MRCSICRRPLLHCAVPGLQIGPQCARKRGLMPPAAGRRIQIITPRRAGKDFKQIDWVNQINAAVAGESENLCL
ncbi:MAG: hypothetical protein IV107_16595 [Paucibacter sp.]|nr:hypothetical protein [Roseateles sp.]